jgi:DNA polymerase epsilon subunit 2
MAFSLSFSTVHILNCVFQSEFAVRIREDLPDLNFFFLSDVWLDHLQTLSGLRKMLDNCVENSFIPKVIVLCGNFTSRSLAQGSGRDIQQYQGALHFVWRDAPPY